MQWIDSVLSKGDKVEFFHDEYRCPVYVKDVVKIVLALTNRWLSGNNLVYMLVLNTEISCKLLDDPWGLFGFLLFAFLVNNLACSEDIDNVMKGYGVQMREKGVMVDNKPYHAIYSIVVGRKITCIAFIWSMVSNGIRGSGDRWPMLFMYDLASVSLSFLGIGFSCLFKKSLATFSFWFALIVSHLNTDSVFWYDVTSPEGKQMQLLLNVGGPDRVSRVQMAEVVADIRGYSTSLIKPVSASSVCVYIILFPEFIQILVLVTCAFCYLYFCNHEHEILFRFSSLGYS